MLRQRLPGGMVARAVVLSGPPTGYTPSLSPGQFYPEDHYANVLEAAYAGLLDGLPGASSSHDFFANSTRGECAQVLCNLLERR